MEARVERRAEIAEDRLRGRLLTFQRFAMLRFVKEGFRPVPPPLMTNDAISQLMKKTVAAPLSSVVSPTAGLAARLAPPRSWGSKLPHGKFCDSHERSGLRLG